MLNFELLMTWMETTLVLLVRFCIFGLFAKFEPLQLFGSPFPKSFAISIKLCIVVLRPNGQRRQLCQSMV